MNFKDTYLNRLTSRITEIDSKRKIILNELASIIQDRLERQGKCSLLFVCTHNSRRSQAAEAWANRLAELFHFSIEAFSGGIEITEFNIRMATALRARGFQITTEKKGTNPKFTLRLQNSEKSMFSKLYNDSVNPSKDFIAIMVCDHANDSCPNISGSSTKISLSYTDPKEADDSPFEFSAYEDCIEEIGLEMLYIFMQISQKEKAR